MSNHPRRQRKPGSPHTPPPLPPGAVEAAQEVVDGVAVMHDVVENLDAATDFYGRLAQFETGMVPMAVEHLAAFLRTVPPEILSEALRLIGATP